MFSVSDFFALLFFVSWQHPVSRTTNTRLKVHQNVFTRDDESFSLTTTLTCKFVSVTIVVFINLMCALLRLSSILHQLVSSLHRAATATRPIEPIHGKQTVNAGFVGTELSSCRLGVSGAHIVTSVATMLDVTVGTSEGTERGVLWNDWEGVVARQGVVGGPCTVVVGRGVGFLVGGGTGERGVTGHGGVIVLQRLASVEGNCLVSGGGRATLTKGGAAVCVYCFRTVSGQSHIGPVTVGWRGGGVVSW